MRGNWLIVFYCLAAIITIVPCLTSCSKENVVTANIDDPLVLEFDIDSEESLEDSYITKNDEKLQSRVSSLQEGKLHSVYYYACTLLYIQPGVTGSIVNERTARASDVSKRPSWPLHGYDDFNVTKCNESRRLFNCRIPTIHKYRTIDGTCNNLRRPLWGASNTEFRRVLSAVYEDGISRPVGSRQQLMGRFFDPPWPSSRHLSEKIVDIDDDIHSKKLTHMHMQWGQFLDHDIDLLGMFDVNCTKVNNDIKFCFPIKVKPTDQRFGQGTVNEARDLPFTRSLPVCPAKQQYYKHGRYQSTGHSYGKSHGHPSYGRSHHQSYPQSHSNSYRNHYQQAREHINRITHFIDASMIYGSDKETQKSLRSFSGGLLKTTGSGKGDLPFSTMRNARGDRLFMAGDERVNEQTGLVVIQTLFHREHNRIAKELSKLNPCWGDEELYQEARKIMGAMIQIITYNEYLPALYGEKWFDFYIGRFKYYSSYTSPTVSNVFTTAFRYGHSQIRNSFSRLDKFYRPLGIGSLDLADAFFNPSEYYRSGRTDPILRGLVVDEAMKNDEFISEGVASLLITSPTSIIATDLVALNIQRGRDHALPPYRRWEDLCIRKFGIRPSFTEPSTVAKFKELYGDYGFRHGMDLWLAGLAEKHLDGSNVGPTFACLLAETFKAIRDGDRFWWEKPWVFTMSQRSTLSKVTLSQVICESSDGIEHIQPKAFTISQDRIKCSLLPKLDLSKWMDDRC